MASCGLVWSVTHAVLFGGVLVPPRVVLPGGVCCAETSSFVVDRGRGNIWLGRLGPSARAVWLLCGGPDAVGDPMCSLMVSQGAGFVVGTQTRACVGVYLAGDAHPPWVVVLPPPTVGVGVGS